MLRLVKELKKAYKDSLAQTVYQLYPGFFYLPSQRSLRVKIDAKSDLYIYFFFVGMHLLNSDGSFCFITSNSWLDVGYGKNLQEFLMKRAEVRMIIDNQVKRSFASADVNTVISLFSAPLREGRSKVAPKITPQANLSRFVMFKQPYEGIVNAIIFQELEEREDREKLPEYRVNVLRQSYLLEEGICIDEDDLTPKYAGNKWGGKYLRASDIYFTIMQKGKKYFDKLSNHFNGERYLNTGGADGFFILTDVHKIKDGLYHVENDNTTNNRSSRFSGEIEGKFLVPLIKDYTKHNKCIEIEGFDAYCLVVDGKPSAKVTKYITWGEENNYHKRSVTKSQRPWYKPTNQMTSSSGIIVPRSFNDSFVIYYNPHGFLSLRFYRLHKINGSEIRYASFLNSSLIALILETLGNKSLGQGVLDFFMADFLSTTIPIILTPDLDRAFTKIKNREIMSVHEEYGKTEAGFPKGRRELDDIIFDELKLTKGERDAVYEAIIELVTARIQKARSLES